MKRLLVLILASLMCLSIVSCSTNGTNVDIDGAVLEGHEGVAFNKLIRRACINYQDDMTEENEDEDNDFTFTVTYKLTDGWNSDKIKERDYVNSKQSAITCSVVMKGTTEGTTSNVDVNFYLIHDIKSNTLKVIGAWVYITADEGAHTQSSFYKDEDAQEILNKFLEDYYYNVD